MPKPKRTNMPDWLQFVVAELTKPPYFMNQEAESPVSQAYAPNTTASGNSAHTSKSATASAAKPRAQRERERDRHTSATDNLDTVRRQPANATRSHRNSDIPERVLDQYEWKIAHTERVPGALKVTLQDGRHFAVKETDIPAKRVWFIHRALNWAKKQGFSRFAPFYFTKAKSPVFVYEGKTYYATSWIDGQNANFASAEHVAQTAYTLAQFHEATKGFSSEKFTPDDVYDLFGLMQQRNRDLRRMIIRADAKRDPDEFDRLLVTLKPALLDDSAECLQILQSRECVEFLESDRRNAGLCHLDVTPGNCLYTPDHHVALIDFDLSTFAPRALDIAHLLRRSFQTTDWDGHFAYACFLHFDSVRSIPKAEYKLVEALLRFPYLPWRLAHTRYNYYASQEQLDDLQQYALQADRRKAFLSSLAEQIRDLSVEAKS